MAATRRSGSVSAEAIAKREIAALEELGRAALLARWQSVFGREAPPRLSRELAVKAIAYAIQVKAFGGLSTRTIRILKGATKPGSMPAETKLPGRGVRLVREWNGVLHEVEALDDGYLWRGERHRSLSAIALAITGTKWSGPRFFGIKAD